VIVDFDVLIRAGNQARRPPEARRFSALAQRKFCVAASNLFRSCF
jgi:hypothetical protein